MHFAHRLAWFYMTGAWPEGDLDHRDLDGDNNRFDNLRPASHGQNMHNVRVRKHSATRLKGVQYTKGGFQAVIRHEKKRIYLGRFSTAAAAHDAYRVAAERLYGEFARAG